MKIIYYNKYVISNKKLLFIKYRWNEGLALPHHVQPSDD